MMGHAPGGVCPFGVNEGVAVYLDESCASLIPSTRRRATATPPSS